MRIYGKRSGRLLDVGCAMGGRVSFFERHGYASRGCDLSQEATDYGRRTLGLDLTCSTLENIDEDQLGQNDVVTMIDLIEHIRDPHMWSMKANNILRKNGLLLLFTPNFDCYDVVGDQWTGFNASFEHLFFYNVQSICNLLAQHGFSVLESSHIKSMPLRWTDVSTSTQGAARESNLSRLRVLSKSKTFGASALANIRHQKLIVPEVQNSILVVARTD